MTGHRLQTNRLRHVAKRLYSMQTINEVEFYEEL